MRRKFLMLALVPLVLVGCEKPAQTAQRSGNFNVEFLFEIDGCKQYRFQDSRSVYTMVCPGGSSNTQRSYTSGKSTYYQDSNQVSR